MKPQECGYSFGQVPVAQPIILATWEAGEDHSSRPNRANSSGDPISKITRAKCTGDVAQALEHLLCKHKALNSNPRPQKKKRI
jgi:hypothetical protein